MSANTAKKENKWSNLPELSEFVTSNPIKTIQVNILSLLCYHVKQM